MAKRIQHQNVASVQKLSIADGGKAYGELREKVMKAKILDRDYWFYIKIASFAFGGFFLSLYFIYTSQTLLFTAIWSLIFAFFAVQLGGFMHDTGHRTIFNSSRKNDILGEFVCMLLAMRYKNWKVKHNLHHAHPNEEEVDTDVAIPFHFTEHGYNNVKGWRRFIRRRQAYFFYPLGSLLAFSMRITGLRDYRKNIAKDSIWGMMGFAIGLLMWFIVPFLVFEPSKAVVFILVANFAMGFYLMNIFAPNHKGMPQLAKGVKLSFAEHQIITSRNVKGSFFTDLMYMGLNYQIEHHLFPNTPRNKLKLITPYLRDFCRKRKLEYTSVGFFQTNRIILSELNAIAKTS